MDVTKQADTANDQAISPLAGDETYGERVYRFIFRDVINFWVNLFASAAFTYWVTHSQTSFKLPFLKKEFSAPSIIQQKIARGIHAMAPMGVFGEKVSYDITNPPNTKRAKAANTLANVLTLVTMGHVIMIPSVWLGAKIKAPMVEWLNRKHYGDQAMEDPSLKARHAAIAIEERPTLLGTVIGRAGTIVATQFTGYTIGNPDNFFRWVGNRLGIKTLQSFPGIDRMAEVAGNKLGQGVEEIFPNNTTRMDTHLRGNHYDWSKKQLLENPALQGQPYQRSAQHMGKYLAQDVLYTFVTATTINPAISFLKKFIPGMTYIPKNPKAEQIVREADHKFRIRPNPLADEVPSESPAPHIKISDIKRVDTVTPRPQEQQLGMKS